MWIGESIGSRDRRTGRGAGTITQSMNLPTTSPPRRHSPLRSAIIIAGFAIAALIVVVVVLSSTSTKPPAPAPAPAPARAPAPPQPSSVRPFAADSVWNALLP